MPDCAITGAEVDEMGTATLDTSIQTSSVLANVETILSTVGRDRTDLVEVSTFLVNMNDFDGYNRAWAEFFAGGEAPARTTLAVHQLPHPHLLIEIKAVASLRDGGDLHPTPAASVDQDGPP